ncbi:protein EVI2B [Pezoporus wallicus]|uniref:protein EVI2B n=1 Tax=Pezoporus wallicus TaxID=35540 RepID=UPI0025507AB1|nr:protein EVI2B [Pezoporus wallicus]XP_061325923.1 protein EVI2B [Pezoporus flaviventris]
MSTKNASASMGSPMEGKAPLYPLQATRASFPKAGGAPAEAPGVTPPAQFPGAPAEDSDGSWVAALIIGIILISMIMAIVIILLCKCRRRPGLAYSHWAGRSPFADGDTPEVPMDSDQATKRSSALFTLPWKFKQDPNLQQELTASEQPPDCTTCSENGELPPPAEDHAAAASPASDTEASPAPIPEATGCAGDSSLHPAPSHDSPDLPPPPDWLTEP